MKRLLTWLRSRPNRVYGAIFGLLMMGAASLYFLAAADAEIGAALVLGLLILVNLLVMIY